MSARILIPVRPPEEGKSRLGSVLTLPERIALNWRFFMHVMRVATNVLPPDHCIVVSRSSEMLKWAGDMGAQAVSEQGASLNEALTQGANVAMGQGADAVLSLSCDLPFLCADDVRAMLETGGTASVICAPDVARLGTNALLLKPPGVIPYSYGANSFATHLLHARRAGQSVAAIDRPGLARDIDSPDELALILHRLSD